MRIAWYAIIQAVINIIIIIMQNIWQQQSTTPRNISILTEKTVPINVLLPFGFSHPDWKKSYSYHEMCIILQYNKVSLEKLHNCSV